MRRICDYNVRKILSTRKKEIREEGVSRLYFLCFNKERAEF